MKEWEFGKDLGDLYYSNFEIVVDTFYSKIPKNVFVRIKKVGKTYTFFIKFLWPARNNPYRFIGRITEQNFSLLLEDRKIVKLTKEDLMIKDIIE